MKTVIVGGVLALLGTAAIADRPVFGDASSSIVNAVLAGGDGDLVENFTYEGTKISVIVSWKTSEYVILGKYADDPNTLCALIKGEGWKEGMKLEGSDVVPALMVMRE